mmetsp:Transcript_46848/g.109396  ORF Transcript_46848/g.109396 Transcript_46848/m.109396 type:complete len:218 (-) Transcript_46848:2-655(-)
MASLEVDPPTGVPKTLHSWWSRVDPDELDRASHESGRLEVLRHLGTLLRSSPSVLELGCGSGLLAQEANRRDIVGVDMCPAMAQKASTRMDTVVTENMLEFYPADNPDAVVLANVLEPYSAEVRRLLLAQIHDYLLPGGQIVLAVTVGETGLGTSSESILDLVFPSAPPMQADEIEEDLLLSGFDVAVPELLCIRREREDPSRVQRRSVAILVGRKV